MEKRQISLVAHTGCMATPMNSVASIEAALAWRVDKIEVDVRFLPDGTPVLTHDPAEPGRGYVLFEQALQLIRPQEAGLVIDLKEWSGLPVLAELLKRYGMLERSVYVGNVLEEMETLRAEFSGIPCYPNGDPEVLRCADPAELDAYVRRAAQAGAAGLGLFHPAVTAQLADILHAHRLGLSAWTVDDPAEIRRMRACGADFITTNRPDLAAELI